MAHAETAPSQTCESCTQQHSMTAAHALWECITLHCAQGPRSGATCMLPGPGFLPDAQKESLIC